MKNYQSILFLIIRDIVHIYALKFDVVCYIRYCICLEKHLK